jgi:hypothetical protein
MIGDGNTGGLGLGAGACGGTTVGAEVGDGDGGVQLGVLPGRM